MAIYNERARGIHIPVECDPISVPNCIIVCLNCLNRFSGGPLLPLPKPDMLKLERILINTYTR